MRDSALPVQAENFIPLCSNRADLLPRPALLLEAARDCGEGGTDCKAFEEEFGHVEESRLVIVFEPVQEILLKLVCCSKTTTSLPLSYKHQRQQACHPVFSSEDPESQKPSSISASEQSEDRRPRFPSVASGHGPELR